MISRVRGTLVRREIDHVEVLTPAGIGFVMAVPLPDFERLPREGSEVELRTVQVVRAESTALYGFLEEPQREAFSRLLNASGVGPKVALDMLSTHGVARLAKAIVERDIPALCQVPGIGKKRAEKLVLELADRMDDLALSFKGLKAQGAAAEEAVAAMIRLGYPASDANAAVRAAVEQDGDLAGAGLIRAALGRVGAN